MTSQADLLPCPFCGSKPTIDSLEDDSDYFVCCEYNENTHPDVEITAQGNTLEQAITAWNQRPNTGCREGFEANVREKWTDADSALDIDPDSGQYVDLFINNYWSVWQEAWQAAQLAASQAEIAQLKGKHHQEIYSHVSNNDLLQQDNHALQAEVEALKDDIAKYLDINSNLATEVERLKEQLSLTEDQANDLEHQNHNLECLLHDVPALRQTNARYREVMEKIINASDLEMSDGDFAREIVQQTLDADGGGDES